MKLLSMKHFPLRSPRPKLGIPKLLEALKRLGTETTVDDLFGDLNTLKGQGKVNTEPKIIMRDEVETVQFEIWLTPLGRTELEKKLST
ncbi:MAG: hypothetical protein KDD82_27955 [Planctomycetes bacterium]|nr:hypothetical protein [Planctomycetota bacterium]